MKSDKSVKEVIDGIRSTSTKFTALWDIAGSTEDSLRLGARCSGPWLMIRKDSIQSIDIVDIDQCGDAVFHKVLVDLKDDHGALASAFRALKLRDDSPRTIDGVPPNVASVPLSNGALVFAYDPSTKLATALTFVPSIHSKLGETGPEITRAQSRSTAECTGVRHLVTS